jgi:tRNA U34 2-thiouridine synthase MnmA/TrmU
VCDVRWLSREHQRAWEATGRLSALNGEKSLSYKSRYREPDKDIVEMVSVSEYDDAGGVKKAPRQSRYWTLIDGDCEADACSSPSAWIEFAEPAFAITPQQYIVLYDGTVCVGSARVVSPGLTVHECPT